MSNLFILFLCGLGSALVSAKPEPKIGDKVKWQVLYESLCPGCRQEMSEQVGPVYQSLSDYVDIELYPYGNARMKPENGKTVVECQHGPDECHGNTIHACAIDILQAPNVYVPFIACMMNNTSTDDDAKQCANDMNIDSNPILECAKSDRGLELLIKTGKESQQFQYHYVPYMVLNGQPMDYTKDLKTEICKLLSNPPPACQ